MGTPELVMRVTAMVLGAGLMALGGVLAYRDGERGCLPFVLVIGGFLLLGAGFPSSEIFR